MDIFLSNSDSMAVGSVLKEASGVVDGDTIWSGSGGGDETTSSCVDEICSSKELSKNGVTGMAFFFGSAMDNFDVLLESANGSTKAFCVSFFTRSSSVRFLRSFLAFFEGLVIGSKGDFLWSSESGSMVVSVPQT